MREPTFLDKPFFIAGRQLLSLNQFRFLVLRKKCVNTTSAEKVHFAAICVGYYITPPSLKHAINIIDNVLNMDM